MNVHQGRITEILFYGDFMATASQTELTDALRGVRLSRDDLDAVLSAFDLPSVFGGITKSEILDLMLGEGG